MPPLDETYQGDVAAVSRIEAVPTILDIVCRTTGMGFAAIARVTEGRWIACSLKDDIAFGLQPGGELQVETTICHEVRDHGEPVIIDDVTEDAVFCNHPTPALYGFRSYISVPIVRRDGTFFGTLCAIDPQPRKLRNAETIGSFKLFAELIAFHLDAQTQIETTQATLFREREISELREQFIAVLGHDLRNPLAAVAAGLRALVQRPERASELAGHIQRSIQRMSGLIDNLMDFARGRLGGGLTLQREAEAALGPVLTDVVEEFRSTHPARVIELAASLPQGIRCDGLRMAQLLSNLVGNALTHGAADKPVRVEASCAAGELVLSVINAGDPIPAAALKTLFHPFVRAAVRPNQDGLGLGLYIAAEIARAHGGTIEVSSDHAQTRFTFRMPVSA